MVLAAYTCRGFVLERQIDLETGGAEWRSLLLRKA
jgi:ribosomal protein L11 methyltransferase